MLVVKKKAKTRVLRKYDNNSKLLFLIATHIYCIYRFNVFII